MGQTWPSLALSWAEQEVTWASWLKLGPNWGSNMAQLGHVWAQVGLSMRNLVCGSIWHQSWAQDKPNVCNMASHEPPSKSHWAAKLARVGPNLAPGCPPKGPTWPNLGPSRLLAPRSRWLAATAGPWARTANSNYYRYMHSTMHMDQSTWDHSFKSMSIYIIGFNWIKHSNYYYIYIYIYLVTCICLAESWQLHPMALFGVRWDASTAQIRGSTLYSSMACRRREQGQDQVSWDGRMKICMPW